MARVVTAATASSPRIATSRFATVFLLVCALNSAMLVHADGRAFSDDPGTAVFFDMVIEQVSWPKGQGCAAHGTLHYEHNPDAWVPQVESER